MEGMTVEDRTSRPAVHPGLWSHLLRGSQFSICLHDMIFLCLFILSPCELEAVVAGPCRRGGQGRYTSATLQGRFFDLSGLHDAIFTDMLFSDSPRVRLGPLWNSGTPCQLPDAIIRVSIKGNVPHCCGLVTLALKNSWSTL